MYGVTLRLWKSTVCYGLPDPEDGGSTVLRNVEDYSYNDTASNPRRNESQSHVTQGWNQCLFWTPESCFLKSSIYVGHRVVFPHTHTHTHTHTHMYTYIHTPRAGRSGDRIPVGARFFAPVQNGPGDHSAQIQWVPGLSRR